MKQTTYTTSAYPDFTCHVPAASTETVSSSATAKSENMFTSSKSLPVDLENTTDCLKNMPCYDHALHSENAHYRFLIIHGPNLNMLGIREPQHYGKTNYADLVEKIRIYAAGCGVIASFFQSNHEGALVDAIQSAYARCDGIIINPGAYTHTSIALLDALRAVNLPAVEVHISDVDHREEFRKISYVRAACILTISGKGTDGYLQAVDALIEHVGKHRDITKNNPMYLSASDRL